MEAFDQDGSGRLVGLELMEFCMQFFFACMAALLTHLTWVFGLNSALYGMYLEYDGGGSKLASANRFEALKLSLSCDLRVKTSDISCPCDVTSILRPAQANYTRPHCNFDDSSILHPSPPHCLTASPNVTHVGTSGKPTIVN